MSFLFCFRYYTSVGWLELYVILYDYGRNTPIYSEHVLHGKSLKGKFWRLNSFR